MDKHYLYKIINTLSNKIYIGQSTEPKRRWKSHLRYSKKGSEAPQYIHRAMNKYGVENFIFEIIATCKTQENTDFIESILIKQYNSANKEFGYNLKAGGYASPHSEETKEKLRQATFKQIAEKGHPGKGYKWTPEDTAKRLETLNKRDKAEIYTPEVRQRMSESQLGYKQSEEHIEKKIKSLTTTNELKIQEKLETGEYKCQVPGCTVEGRDDNTKRGVIHYRVIDGIKCCPTHFNRFNEHGTFDKNEIPKFSRKGMITKRTRIFTEEELNYILTDSRGMDPIAKEFNVHPRVISKIRKENNYFPHTQNNKTIFTKEQIELILKDPRGAGKIAKDFGTTQRVILRVKKEYNR